MLFWLAAIVPLWFAAAAEGQFMPRPTVIENVHIHTPDGRVIEGGTIIVRGSRIGSVGADVSVPRRAMRIDGEGLHATPGLIDVLSALAMPVGISGGNNPIASAHDAFDRYDSRAIEEAITNGITTIYVAPTGHRGFGPAGSIIRLRPNDDDTFGEVLEPRFALSMNMHSAGDPVERLQTVDAIRSQLRDARNHEEALELYEEQLETYLEKLKERREADDDGNQTEHADHSQRARGTLADNPDDAAAQPRRRGQRPRPGQRGRGQGEDAEDDADEDDDLEKPSPPAPNPQLDVLIKALNHELPVRVRADRAEDILNALEIAEEFMLNITLEGGAEAHLVAEEIAAAGVPVILAARPTGDLPRRGTQLRTSRDAAATLDRAGVEWTISSGAQNAADSRYLLFAAYLLMQHSPVEINPLELLTSRAARMLGIDDRLGRLQEGMQADIVLWSGDPADPVSRVERVIIAGQTIFQRTEGDS